MPRTLTVPTPAPDLCPVCDHALLREPCPFCGARLASPAGRELRRVDVGLHELATRRTELVRTVLRREPAPAAPAEVPAPPADVPPPPPPAPPRPGLRPPPAPAPPRPAPQSSLSVAQLLVGLGGLSLVAAVVVFAAVSWSDLAAWAQGALLVAATGAVLATATACSRRGLAATAESLGAVSVALALADVHVVRTGLDGLVDSSVVWALGLAAVAAGALWLGRDTGIRSLGIAGAGIAFLPALVGVSAADSATASAWVLAAEAVAAAALVFDPRVLPAERRALRLGAGASWVVAAVMGVGLGILELGPDGAIPLGPVALLACLSASSIAVGRRSAAHTLTAAGTGLAFVPPLLIAAGPGTAATVAGVLVVESAVAVALPWWHARARAGSPIPRPVMTGLDVVAAPTWLGAAVTAAWLGLAELGAPTPVVPVVPVALLAALAGVAVLAAVLERWSGELAELPLLAAVGAILGAAAFATGTHGPGVVVAAVMLVAGGLFAAMALLPAGSLPRTVPMAATATVVALASTVPLGPIGSLAAAVVDSFAHPAADGLGGSFRAHLEAASPMLAGALPTAATLAQLAGVALVGVGGILLGRRWGATLLAGTGAAAVAAGPLALGAGIGTSALVLAVAVAATGWWLIGRPGHPAAAGPFASLGALLVAVSSASPWACLGAVILVSGLCVAVAVPALRGGDGTAHAWVAASMVSSLAGALVVPIVHGHGGSVPASSLAVGAVLAAAVAPSIERQLRGATLAAASADLVVGIALVVALAGTRSLDAASAVVGLIAFVLGASALRPTRAALWPGAPAAVVLLIWMRLADAGVALLEAYSLPLAAALLAAGAVARRQQSSWERFGAGLLAALAPTTVVAVTGLDGSGPDLVRTVAALLAAVGVVLWGAGARLQAPVAVGAGSIAVIALRHMAPVAVELPRYLVLTVAGVVLLAAGATFEQRRRDVRSARDAFCRLG